MPRVYKAKGELIRDLREAKKLSQNDLADQAQISRPTAQKLEKSCFSYLSTFYSVAAVLGCQPEAIYDPATLHDNYRSDFAPDIWMPEQEQIAREKEQQEIGTRFTVSIVISHTDADVGDIIRSLEATLRPRTKIQCIRIEYGSTIATVLISNVDAGYMIMFFSYGWLDYLPIKQLRINWEMPAEDLELAWDALNRDDLSRVNLFSGRPLDETGYHDFDRIIHGIIWSSGTLKEEAMLTDFGISFVITRI